MQNLLALRFANILFEPIWNSAHIDHVQITVAETVGAGTRGYYDESGALRDMVQNHMMQLLCLVAMEPPASDDANALRDEKLKVLRSLKPITGADVGTLHRARPVSRRLGRWRSRRRLPGRTARGKAGRRQGRSRTETFVALKAEIENWRWAGVPFYIRTGKRLPSRASEIVIQFRNIPHSMFDHAEGAPKANRLVIRIQPDEGVKLFLMIKDPGPGGMRLREVPLNLSFAETFAERTPEAYERLLLDVIRGTPDPVHAPRRTRGGLDVGRSDPRRLGRARPTPAILHGRHLGPHRRHRADRARRPHLARGRDLSATRRSFGTKEDLAARAGRGGRRAPERRHRGARAGVDRAVRRLDAGPVLFGAGRAARTSTGRKVTVTLVDERWVPETSDRSNAGLVNEKLLQGPAATAHFVPLYAGRRRARCGGDRPHQHAAQHRADAVRCGDPRHGQ